MKVIFLCHGNICRSPMAEYILKYLVDKNNVSNLFEISSRATSNEEYGNDIYPPAKPNQNSKALFSPLSNGAKITPPQPIRKYKLKCSHLNLPGPNIDTKVIPVIIIIHCTTKTLIPITPPVRSNNMGAYVPPISK